MPPKGFTLIELLLVIGIVSIISVVIVIVLNPVNIFKELRDSRRLSDMSTLTRALSIAETESVFMGTNLTIYTSLVDTFATTTAGTTCTYATPLPSGYWYHCPASSTQLRVDGTGWIPVNFNGLTLRPPLSRLPQDPLNTTSSYYSYAIADGDWTVYAGLESDKYFSKAENDGGVSSCIYEQGRVLQPYIFGNYLALWGIYETKGQLVRNCATNTNHGTLGATSASGNDDPTWVTLEGKAALYFDLGDHVRIENSNDMTEGSSTLTVSAKVMLGITSLGSALVTKNQTPNLVWSLWHDNTNHFRFAVENTSGAAEEAITDANNYVAGVWYHVVGVYNGSNVDIYVNGVDADSSADPLTGNIQNENIPILFGADWNGSGASPSFFGALRDVRIYRTALSAAQILDSYESGL